MRFEVADPDATYAYTFDADGRLATVSNAGTPNMPSVTLTYTYDQRDNVTRVSDNVGGQIDYTYDTGDRMTRAKLNNRYTVDMTYTTVGQLASLSRTDPSAFSPPMQFGVAVGTSLAYDAAGRVTSIQHTKPGATLASYSLTWDAASQLTQEVSSVDGTANFSYDTTGQLTGVTGWRTETYTYNLTGNRTMTGYSTGTGNRLTSDGVYNYTYDNEGNTLTKTRIADGELTEYTWDYRNRLTKVLIKTSGGTVLTQADFTYDANNDLLRRVIDADGAGPNPATETRTVYDPQPTAHSPQPLSHAYADFNSSNTLTNRYLYGPAVDMILANVNASTTAVSWHLTDHLGSVRDLANAFGAVIDHITYNSFGNILSESNPTAGDRFKYTAREWESAIDLYHYRARWYDDDAGRFLSQDPIGFAGGDANIYRYVRNRVTKLTDPSGLQPEAKDGPIFKLQLESEWPATGDFPLLIPPPKEDVALGPIGLTLTPLQDVPTTKLIDMFFLNISNALMPGATDTSWRPPGLMPLIGSAAGKTLSNALDPTIKLDTESWVGKTLIGGGLALGATNIGPTLYKEFLSDYAPRIEIQGPTLLSVNTSTINAGFSLGTGIDRKDGRFLMPSFSVTTSPFTVPVFGSSFTAPPITITGSGTIPETGKYNASIMFKIGGGSASP